MEQSNLLPVNAITSELISKLANILSEEDSKLNGEVPEWWKVLAKETQTDEFYSIIESAMVLVNQVGINKAIGGLMLKAMYAGWRMADLYLSEQLEKTAD